MTVFDLKAGERARVAAMNVGGGARERLYSLGVARGKYITLLGYSLFKSSALISCGAARVALRRSIAEKIEVSK